MRVRQMIRTLSVPGSSKGSNHTKTPIVYKVSGYAELFNNLPVL